MAAHRGGSRPISCQLRGGAFVWNLRPFTALAEQSQRETFIRYAGEKFTRTTDPVKLFVMAHTHIPYLARVRLMPAPAPSRVHDSD